MYELKYFSTGETLNKAGYAVFSSGEPNNVAGDEFCGSVGRNGKLFDDPCSRQMMFICEKSTDEIVCEENNVLNEENDFFTGLDESKKVEMLKNIVSGSIYDKRTSLLI